MRRRLLICVPVILGLLVTPGIVLAQDAPIVDDAAVSLLAASVVATRQVASMHIAVSATGSIPDGPDGSSSLDDATMDADLDIANHALAIRAEAPSLDLSNLELRIVGDSAYLNADLLGEDDQWIKTEPTMLIELILSTIPGGPRIVDGEHDQDRVEKVIRKRLGRADASASIAGEEACAAGTCTRIHIEAPLEADTSDLFGLFGGMGPAASPGPTASGIPVERAMTLDLLVDTATTRLDSVVMAQGSDESELTITVTMSGYDLPVTIEAPPADQVEDWSID